jgi:hypothetical protein
MKLQGNPSDRKRRRLAFSLKSIFLIVTVLCLWLGYNAAYRVRARQVVARHNQVITAIARNIASPPKGMQYHSPRPQDEGQILARAGWPKGIDPKMAVSPLDTSPGRIETESFLLDIPNLAGSPNPSRVVWQVIEHYGNGLEELGLITGANFTGTDRSLGSHASAVWISPSVDLNVSVDVDIDFPTSTAHVTIVSVDSQRIQLW